MEPDIEPLRLSPVDVASLTNVEVRTVLVRLAGHSDPAVAQAVVDVTREVLHRTRGGQD
jgi:hypothetical protein